MICDGYFGELSDERKANWNCKDNDPLKVLKKNIAMVNYAGILLKKADYYFHDEIQIDWGSWAWKCSKDEILIFQRENKISFTKELDLSDGVEYGAVFIDSGFCGEDLYE